MFEIMKHGYIQNDQPRTKQVQFNEVCVQLMEEDAVTVPRAQPCKQNDPAIYRASFYVCTPKQVPE